MYGIASGSVDFTAQFHGTFNNGLVGRMGIALNSTTTPANTFESQTYSPNSSVYPSISVSAGGAPTVGANYIAALEYGVTGTTFLSADLFSAVGC